MPGNANAVLVKSVSPALNNYFNVLIIMIIKLQKINIKSFVKKEYIEPLPIVKTKSLLI